MHMHAKCIKKYATWFKSYEHVHLTGSGRTRIHVVCIVQTQGSCNKAGRKPPDIGVGFSPDVCLTSVCRIMPKIP